MNKKVLLLFLLLAIGMVSNVVDTTYSISQPGCLCESDPVLSRTEQPVYNELLHELQKYWELSGFYHGKPNGFFDRTMENAVKDFQKAYHLQITGKIDRETWKVIGSVTEASSSTGNLPAGRVEILVDINSLTLTVMVDRSPFRSFPIAIGKLETPSPIGSWQIINKGYWAKGETKWLGLSVPYGVYGIHGTNQPWSIGRRASKGCIRIYNHHLEDLYRWVEPGTPVYIVGDPFRDRRLLKRGLIGSDVYFLQLRLKQLGYFKGQPNGFFEYWTEEAVKKCQQDLGLPVTGEISAKEYYRLKLYPTD
jgi:peptidoglycan hydrolase-like protein with peptidoglycan-binding domain